MGKKRTKEKKEQRKKRTKKKKENYLIDMDVLNFSILGRLHLGLILDELNTSAYTLGTLEDV